MRVNFFCGPGGGKSSTAAWLFSEAKLAGYSVELVTEYVKSWAIEKRNPTKYDQIYFLAKQLRAESRNINGGIKNIITDSPIMLSAIYSEKYFGEGLSNPSFAISDEFDRENPSINIFLNRSGKPYITEGRFQTEEEAEELDTQILRSLQERFVSGRNLFYCRWNDRENIKDIAFNHFVK